MRARRAISKIRIDEAPLTMLAPRAFGRCRARTCATSIDAMLEVLRL